MHKLRLNCIKALSLKLIQLWINLSLNEIYLFLFLLLCCLTFLRDPIFSIKNIALEIRIKQYFKSHRKNLQKFTFQKWCHSNISFFQCFPCPRRNRNRDWFLGFATRWRLHLHSFRSPGFEARLQFLHSDQGKLCSHALAHSSVFCHHGRWNSFLHHRTWILLLKSKFNLTFVFLTIKWKAKSSTSVLT